MSLLTIEEDAFEVKATTSDTDLGGHDFINLIADFYKQEVPSMVFPTMKELVEAYLTTETKDAVLIEPA